MDTKTEGHVAEVEDAIAAHVESHHLGLSSEEMENAFREHYSLLENGRKLDMLVDDYFGAPITDIDGEVHRVGGAKEVAEERWEYTVSTLKTLQHGLENGGVPAKIKLTTKQIVGLIVAFAPVLAASITALSRSL